VTQLLDNAGQGHAGQGHAGQGHAGQGHDGQGHAGAEPGGLAALAGLVAGGRVVILSGAGLSTESGIPDYRGPTGLARRAGPPMTYQAFTGSAAARQRYWARSHLGWGYIADAKPNAGHQAVAELGRRGLLTGIITQNVDGLHQAAGAWHAGPAAAVAVIELHGSLSWVRCLACGQRTPRLDLDRRLRQANPDWAPGPDAPVNPDGDVELADQQVASFRVVDCTACGGLLMPDVVFFGENVPRPRVDTCFALVERSAALVVLGSSLKVMSGYRFVRHAARIGVPVAIVNQGATRGDPHAAITLDAALGDTLTELVRRTCA
jgi:NAD-dependent SIR2 family protein deacetylase